MRKAVSNTTVKLVTLATAIVAVAAYAGPASFKNSIPLLPGEVWWGGGGGDGQNQPYGLKDSRRINLRRSGNTSSPLLVSSAGRYVWSEKPFEYQFVKGTLVLESRAERIELVVRAMEYEFPHQGFNHPMQQFMLGDNWLVASVTTPDDAKTVELPAGTWRDDLGEEHVGPKTLHLKDVPLDRLPRYERGR